MDKFVYIAYNAYMSGLQYTIRNIPPELDKVIRKRAKESETSFNQTVVDILNLQVFGKKDPVFDEDFDWLFSTNTIEDSFDKAVEEMSEVDATIWE